MAFEIERKFLVANPGWQSRASSRKRLQQFYLALDGASSIRVRIVDGTSARLTIKSAEPGLRRSEFEYEIPIDDARAMLPLAIGSVVDKERHIVTDGSRRWEVDVFRGDNAGLVVAEIELASEDEKVELPEWVGDEVTDDRRYYNAALARHPYAKW